jgi:hypothetical protein
VDKRVAQINGNEAAYRASEDDAFLASMANTLESAFFYESRWSTRSASSACSRG